MGRDSELEELRQQVRELAARVQRLEAMPDSAASPTPPGQAATPPPAATVRRPGETPPVPEHIRETGTTTSGVTTSGTAKSGTTAGTKTAGTTRTLEQRIGSQLFNRVGIVAVLFAMAWFLKLAFDRNWIGPPVQIAIGLILAVALALWSERFRHKGYPAFSYTLKALGSGIAYLSLWASFNVYHLVPAAVAFLGMVAVTVTNAYFSWRQRSEVLATYALLGGLVTPGLLSTGEDHEIFLFGYLLLLSVGVVLLADLRSWLRLPVGAFVGTGFYFFAWFGEFYHPPLAALTLTFVALFFVVFSAVPLLTLRSFGSESAPPAASIFLVAAPVAIALLAAIEAYSLVAHPQQAWLRQWIALVLAAASIALSHLARLQPRANVAERKFFVTQEALAAFFVALAIWFHFTGYAIVLGWLGEALAGIAIAFWRPRPGRRELGAAVVVLCFLSLLLLEISDPLHQPVDVVLNAHFATYMAALAAFAVALRISVLGLRHAEQKSVLSWSALAALLTIAFNVVALWSVAFEIHHYWTCGASLAGNLCRVIDPRDLVYSQFAYSGWFMAYGAALMATGFLARSAFLRWQALVLLALAIAKVFLFDASQLSQGYRVASFLALGVVLLAISFAYQHDWLALRRDT